MYFEPGKSPLPEVSYSSDKGGDSGFSNAHLPDANRSGPKSATTTELSDEQLAELINIARPFFTGRRFNALSLIHVRPFFDALHSFAPELESIYGSVPEKLGIIEALRVMNDALNDTHIAHNRLAVMNYMEGPQVILADIHTETWQRYAYLGREFWTADITFTDAPKSQMGVSVKNLALTDSARSYADSIDNYRMMKQWSFDPGAPMTVRILQEMLFRNNISAHNYSQKYGVRRTQLHELRHTEDHVFLEICKERLAPSLSASECLLTEDSPIREHLQELKHDPILVTHADVKVSELSALLVGLQYELKEHAEIKNDRDTVCAFCDFFTTLSFAIASHGMSDVPNHFSPSTSASGILLQLFRYELGRKVDPEDILLMGLADADPALFFKYLVDEVSKTNFRGYMERSRLVGIKPQRKSRKKGK